MSQKRQKTYSAVRYRVAEGVVVGGDEASKDGEGGSSVLHLGSFCVEGYKSQIKMDAVDVDVINTRRVRDPELAARQSLTRRKGKS